MKVSTAVTKPARARQKAPLVIHSLYKARLESESGRIAGIFPELDDYYHSSSMSEFEKRTHTGNTPTYYGVALGVQGSFALGVFIDWLSGVKNRIKPKMNELSDIEAAEDELSDLTETERASIVKARLGQGRFRGNLLDYWSDCAVSGVKLPAFLRASHIKPWRDCTNTERMDTFNGLLLNTTLDAAFDRGYISFSDEGEILVSRALDPHKTELGISNSMSLKQIDERHLGYLSWHRQYVFNSFAAT